MTGSQAIILAGGLGTRLRSAIGDVPKAMADIAGRPFLAILLDQAVRQGVTRVILAVGYRREQIIDYFGDSYRGISLVYATEDTPLGTGGAVKNALAFAGKAPCFVLNGDTTVDLDFAGMLERHQAANATLSIAVVHQDDVGRFGSVAIEQGRIVGFVEKSLEGPGWINSGTYLMAHNIFEQSALPEQFSLERDFFQPNMDRLKPLAYEAAGGFLDIGVPDDYERARELARKGLL